MSRGVEENYYALCICVLTERIPEEAFREMGLVKEKIKAKETDIDEVLRLKKSLTWKEIGELYGVSSNAIQKRVKRRGGDRYQTR